MRIHASSFTFFQFPTGLDTTQLRHPTFGNSSLIDMIELGTTQIERCRLKPIGPLEMTTAGFMDVIQGTLSADITFAGEQGLWLAVGLTKKILPAAAVHEALTKRLKEFEEQHGRQLGGRERKRMKDDLLHDMLPSAFNVTKRTDAIIFPRRGLLAVGTASPKAAEHVVSEIRGCLGSFPALPLNAEVSPREVLTNLLAYPAALEDSGLFLGDGAKLVDPIEGGASVTLKDQELICDEVDKHLEAGKQVKSLDLVHGDRSRFTLGEDLVLRKLKIGEAVMDEVNDEGDSDAFQIATMTILCAELLPLFDIMATAFKLTPAPEA